MEHSTERAAPKRRGRRAGGEDTKAALLEAAREVFVERGYDGATVRVIAARAGVDAAMVNHWFGGKEGLFAKAVLQFPVDPGELVERVLDGPREQLGERIARMFLTVWDTSGGGSFAALVRSVTAHEQVARVLRELFLQVVLKRVVGTLDVDRPELRAALCASQIVGMGMVRYVVSFEPLVSAEVETLVAAVGPTLQRYLTGDISTVPSKQV
ncbi:TetR/AcrR family transcriptional regulator [Saccharothrix coeruleofusca]|uniref:TetR family transcriptional regulator n=1 Tax=Saccharothrix coeruleofusca TaxID=33919 RepID=A0A918AKJ1_9PSEU|nr:TetR family transcriptional regulator [Saccharothrix coeruleofusca]MBP2338299.1 AcrR family transcriptional regulator [Saccharothrix coeruleofusca]GGP49311.1 TetR family transcriptional regulator [Saccharothrix coeruleofusca]